MAFGLGGGLFGCSPGDGSSSAEVLHRGIAGEPSTLDPAAGADTFSTQVIQDLYEGLTAESATGEAVPAAASSWETNESGTVYTFHIRADSKWSNGKPVLAQEFVDAWRRVVDPKQGSPVADNLRLLRGAADIIAGKASPTTLGVSAPSENVLVVTLDRPAPYLPELLTHSSAFPIYSEQSARTHNPDEWVSNGPYVLSRWQNGDSIELTKNPAYWDRARTAVRKVDYHIASDENSQYAQYRAGQLDMTDTVPASAIPSVNATRSSELRVAPYLATAYYGLNLRSRPLATELKLRKALSMAIDRSRLISSFGFGQPPAYSFVPPGIWNYEQQSYAWKNLNSEARIAEARQLYTEAGFSANAPLHLRVLFGSNVVIKRTAIMIAAMWKETLGVDSILTEQEYRGFLVTRHDKTQWDIARLAWVGDFNDASNFLDTFRSNSNNNDEGYANPEYDKLLDEAAMTADSPKRRGALESAERVMLNDYPIAPLYFYVSKRLVKPYVVGVQPTPLDRVPSKSLSLRTH
jgi:oligopeptide transport system substrate-binding protein